MKIRYQDRWIIVAGSLLLGYFFVHLGQTDSLFVLWSRPLYFRDVVVTALITAIVWTSVRTATVFLDVHYDWFTHPTRRSIGQILLGFGLPVLVSLVLTMLFFRFIIEQDIATSSFPVYEFPISVLVIFFINLYYVGAYLYVRASKTVENVSQNEAVTNSVSFTRQTLIVNSGLRNIPLATTDAAFFYIEASSVFVMTFSEEKYLVSSSLDELAQDLSTQLFFRVNRQFLVHRRACKSYLNESYGKLRLEVVPPIATEIIISQQKAPAFKKWLEE
ncbi:LytR/AlgR family response regulator transcription factor [Tellurirhabdus bombi]|uniref:LytR/AlgR family response regulator transcription factor n=1 Tax=Tellurirhabdus bombi TaxID=2907205 RepID=UPI001F474E51|nr:LytTR family DNA-binding domain-containing protein [Tellurirhabdus bombi]